MRLTDFGFLPHVVIFACWFWTAGSVLASSTPFAFSLDESSKTSAGVFTPDGTLIRTLWSKVYYQAGTNSAVWDGLDDSGNPVTPGTYQIKLLQHNTEYVWDGAIGNTSAERSGPMVHAAYLPMRDMAITGTNAFYVTGYNEGKYDFDNFLTTDPQHVRMKWSADGQAANQYDRNWGWTATDGNRVYFACDQATDPTNLTAEDYPGFVVASNVGDNSPATFNQGVPIINGAYNSTYYPNGIYVGTQPGLSGLAVQQSGNLLAVAVTPDNRVYLLDKLSGMIVTNFDVVSPGRMNFSPDGSLWLVSSNDVVCYTNIATSPTLALTIAGFSNPLAVAVNPADANLILVADGGGSQQVKAFDGTGTPLWNYGLAGGYQANGVAVTTNKFWFDNAGTEGTFVCFAPDGSFWVGDGGNHRSLHFSAAREYIEQIMFQPHSWMACVDQNNPSRVFNQFLEFSVDYTKPLQQAWTLVNNWKANVDPCNISWNEGLREVTTFTNGRTYALVDDNCQGNVAVQEVCELGTNGLRLTGLYPFENGGWISFGPDGSVRVTTIGTARWYESTLNGFDGLGNPMWNPSTLIASAPDGATDPVPRGFSIGNVRATISTNNILIAFDQSLNNGWHLGGIKVGATNWLWKASPAATYLNGLGNYEIANGVQYGGSTVQAVNRQVVYGYQGEDFRGSGEAAQHMHFYDDGLFIGQFGEALNGHPLFEGLLPGFAGNGQCPNFLETTNGDYYLWDNDESAHGPQRWHFVNARNIREQTGCGALGSTINLTNQPIDFPTAVIGKNGNASGELCWLPVPGAGLYNIYYSTRNGGPYPTLAGSTTATNYAMGGLTNGQTYYFAVTAITDGVEGIPSEQVAINPFDTSQMVLGAGLESEAGEETPVIEVSSSAATNGQPSNVGAEHLTGVLSPQDLNDYGYGDLQRTTIGTKGYALFEYQGPATSVINILPPFTYTYDAGWIDINNLEWQYRVDDVLNLNNGMVANPVGTLLIGSADTKYHYLTVVSPARFDAGRKFTLGLISENGNSAHYEVDEPNGYSHVFQFLFKGNVTLYADGAAGGNAVIQAIFLDDAPVTDAALVPPTNSLADITNGLVVSYPLATNGADATGQNDLTLFGAPVFSAGAVDWNGGVPTYGCSAPQQWPQTGLTVSSWINLTNPSGIYSVASCYGDPAKPVGSAYFQFYTYGGKLGARVVQNTDVNYIGRYTPPSLTVGWHFVAFTWSGENTSEAIRIYLDGTRIDDTNNESGYFSGPYSGSDVPLSVGAQLSFQYGIDAPFYGSQKQVRLYNRVLADTEIGTLYTNGLNVSGVANPGLNGIQLSGNNLLLDGSVGSSGMSYTVLMSTNLALPFSQWTPVATNLVETNGTFSITITNAVNPAASEGFYILKSQ